MAYQPKSYRKFLAGTVTAAVVASAIAPAASAAPAAKTFPDLEKIKNSEPEAYKAVNYLVDLGVIQGYKDGTFKPNQTLTRGNAAEMLVKALGLTPKKAGLGKVFKDQKANSYHTPYSEAIAEAGIISGFTDGTFGPSKGLTREQMAKILVNAYGLKDTGEAVTIKDLNRASAGQAENIKILAQHKITNLPGGNFNPKAQVKRSQFALFLYRVMEGGNVSAAVEGIKAINATTVEITYKDAVKVEDVKAANYTIEGLEVSNAAIKQTNSKVVVLTTSTQTGDKQYTVKENGSAIGKFTGVSAVIPSKVAFTEDSMSQQGITGQQVTVKAKVTVEEGKSKAGIPVTFNVKAATGSFNDDQVKEVATNAEGVATYTYTQYSKGEDVVTAYATGDASKRDSGAKVYWGAVKRLTLSEVTEGNSLVNGAKKVYKVSSPENAGKYVNIAFKENIGVTPDKAVRGVKVTDKQYGGDYPYQYTTGGTDYVQIKLDGSGNATFTLTGTNSKVTPIVFISEATSGPATLAESQTDKYKALNKYSATSLQAVAANPVAFDAIQSFAIKIESQGVAGAAQYKDDNNRGGRNYKAIVTDKDGKLAPKGTTVYMVVPSDKLDKKKKVWYVDQSNPSVVKEVVGDQLYPFTTNAKGEINFTLLGQENAFATPIVMQDNGTVSNKLDKADLQTEGDIVYFGKAIIEKATLEVLDANDNEVTSVLGNGTDVAKFVYQSVDQNGNPYTTGTNYIASFQVTAGFNDITTSKGIVRNGETATFDVAADANGKAVLTITSGKVSTASVRVAASQTSLPVLNASVSFTDSKELPAKYTGIVEKISNVYKTIKFVGYDAVSYAKSTSFKNANGVALSVTEFEQLVKANEGTIKVTAAKNSDGVYAFEIVSVNENIANSLKLINSATSVEDIQKALVTAGLTPEFSKLNATQKTEVAKQIETARNNAGYQLNEAGLKAAYAAAYKGEVDKALRAVEDVSTTEAELQAVPGLDLSKFEKLSPEDKTDVLGLIYTAATAAKPVADAAALQTIVNKAIADHENNKNSAIVNEALQAFNSANTSEAMKLVLRNEKYTKALMLDTSVLNVDEFNSVADALGSLENKNLNPVSVKNLFAATVAKAKDKTAPAVKSVELQGSDLIFTFSESVNIGDINEAELTFKDADGTLATAKNKSVTKDGDTKIKISAANTGISKGHFITALKFYNTGAPQTEIFVQDFAIPTPNKFTFESKGYEVK